MEGVTGSSPVGPTNESFCREGLQSRHGTVRSRTRNGDFMFEEELTENYSPLERLRHSTAHVMASAVKELFPEAKIGIGPAIETMAAAEELEAHKNAVSLRFKEIKD